MDALQDIDLKPYDLGDLTDFRQRLDKEIKLREMEKARMAKKALRETANAYGYNLNDLIKPTSPERRRQGGNRARVVRFRHPDDDAKVWGGRGRKPAWVREWQAAGGTLDDLRVAPGNE